jgi:hypothetical protein
MPSNHAGFTRAPQSAAVMRAVPAQRLCSPEPPPCPVCGTLECLCRPRWVAGQIVSEADLNRLDRYMTGKQQLHNRHLFGTGVVCGLVVHCHPCDTGVLSVSPGYALGPCGEDIVVCAPDTVPVCEMIQCCRAQETSGLDCRPFGDDRGCRDVEEEWVLAIRYEEHAARTEPRIHTAACPSCGGFGLACACGKGGMAAHPRGCGCGCGGTGGKLPPPRSAPVECAPTITCEGYRYEVFRAPRAKPPRDGRRPSRGALFDRYAECVEELIQAVRVWARDRSSPDLAVRQRACAALKAALVAHYSEHGTSHCEEVSRLCSIICTGEDMAEADRRLIALVQAAIQNCLCDALLPPCPEPTSETRVPLATFTVQGSPCRVLRVCNWTPLRQIVLTFPNLLYWLSIFPQGAQVRELLHRLCCVPLPPLIEPRLQPGIFAAAVPPGAGAAPGFEALLGKWLLDLAPEPGDALAMLGIAAPQELAALRAEVAALREEVARLGPNG